MKVLIFLLWIPMALHSQNVEHLQWQKRVILMYADRFDNPRVQEQAALLYKEQKLFDDYNLTIIECTQEGERRDFGKIDEASSSKNSNGFKVQLIGMDGSIKFESSVVQPVNIFFDLIDAMPMRQRELRKKGG